MTSAAGPATASAIHCRRTLSMRASDGVSTPDTPKAMAASGMPKLASRSSQMLPTPSSTATATKAAASSPPYHAGRIS